jgi:hypothetical protein
MLMNDRLGVRLGHSAMSGQCPVCPKADVDPRSRDVAKSLALRSASFKMPSPERIAAALKKHKMEVLEAPGTA